MVHITCLAHAHAEVRGNFLELNELVSNVKRVFYVEHIREADPGKPLLHQPVLTLDQCLRVL